MIPARMDLHGECGDEGCPDVCAGCGAKLEDGHPVYGDPGSPVGFGVCDRYCARKIGVKS